MTLQNQPQYSLDNIFKEGKYSGGPKRQHKHIGSCMPLRVIIVCISIYTCTLSSIQFVIHPTLLYYINERLEREN